LENKLDNLEEQNKKLEDQNEKIINHNIKLIIYLKIKTKLHEDQIYAELDKSR
jgi:hypothetical protein